MAKSVSCRLEAMAKTRAFIGVEWHGEKEIWNNLALVPGIWWCDTPYYDNEVNHEQTPDGYCVAAAGAPALPAYLSETYLTNKSTST